MNLDLFDVDAFLSEMSGLSAHIPEKDVQPMPTMEPLPEPMPETEPVLSHMWEQPDKCPFCLYWQEVKGQCYWRGMCALDGKPASIGQKCRQVINF